ncbi:tryptophan synthase subunit alpha [Aurantivibrio plasticivorans]
MSRIEERFAALKKENRKALVTYIVNGDPSLTATLPTMHALVEGGADIIELGVPFSDPMADGGAIQLGHQRALENKASLRSSLAVVEEFRKSNKDVPVVLMGYENPIERMGYETFAAEAERVGVDGVIIVDLPPEEGAALKQALADRSLNMIYLVAPSTTEERAKKIIACASGFLYYVSVKGVTGSSTLDTDDVNDKLNALRELTDLPICVGFGIKTGDSARAVTQISDGAVVGSLFVDAMGQRASKADDEIAAAVKELVAPIRAAIDS